MAATHILESGSSETVTSSPEGKSSSSGFITAVHETPTVPPLSEFCLWSSRMSSIRWWSSRMSSIRTMHSPQPFMVSTITARWLDSGHTITALFCHLDPEKLEVAKADFAKLETDGIVWCSSSGWSSTLHLVKKLGQLLNLISTTDKYPLLNMADLDTMLDGTAVLSKLDLNKGYTIRYQSTLQTSWMRQLSQHLAYLSSCESLLASKMLAWYSRGWWTGFSGVNLSSSANEQHIGGEPGPGQPSSPPVPGPAPEIWPGPQHWLLFSGSFGPLPLRCLCPATYQPGGSSKKFPTPLHHQGDAGDS